MPLQLFINLQNIETGFSKRRDVTIKLTAQGSGKHHFKIRTDKLTLATTAKVLDLKPGTATNFEWHANITSKDTPWVAVVVANDNLSQRQEVRGAVWEK